MSELRYNNQIGILGATLDANPGSEVVSSLFASPPDFGLVGSPDYVKLCLDADPISPGVPNPNFEIVYLTAYTPGQTGGTILRGQEGTTPVAHFPFIGTWANSPTANDFVIPVDGSPSTPSLRTLGTGAQQAAAGTAPGAAQSAAISAAAIDATTKANNAQSNAEAYADATKAALVGVVASITSGGSVTVNKLNPINALSAPITMTLPTGQSQGTWTAVQKTDTSTNVVTVSGSIRGVTASITLVLTNETIWFTTDSTGSWWPLASHKTLGSLDTRYGTLGTDSNDQALTISWTSLGPIAKLVNPNDVGDDLILVVGQSNADGYGTPIDVVNFDPANPRIWQFANANSNVTNGNQKIMAVDPLWYFESAHGNQVGPAMTFARTYLQTVPTNRNVLIVPAACGGTGFTTSSVTPPPAGFQNKPLGGCWLVGGDGAGGVNLYQLAVNQTNAALALNPNNRIVAIIWVQGEDDAQVAMDPTAYQADLDALFTAFRANITGASNVPIIVGQMNPNWITSGGFAGAAPINLKHIDTPRRVLRTAFNIGVPSAGDAVNGLIHYSASDQRIIGRRMLDSLARAKANILGTPPIAPGIPVLTQTGTTVNIVWPQPICRVTDFTAQYQDNGGSFSTITRTIPNIDVTAQLTGMTPGHTIGVKVSTTNEAGTSAYSSVGTLVLQTIPVQVTGLTATPDATVSKVTLAWAAVANATGGYQVNYRVTGAGSWTSFGIVTANGCVIQQLISSTGYDFQVAAINNAGQGTFSATANATTPAVTAPIQAVGVTAWRAYGLRKLSSLYGGNAALVRRSSDNTTQAIGFNGTGDLDVTSLLTFCGGGNGFVNTWYDQSGSGFDLTQATTTKQVQIVTSGALTATIGGKPAARGSLIAGYIDTHTGLVAAGAASALAVFNAVTVTVNASAFGEYGTTFYQMLINQPAAWGALFGFTGGTVLVSVTPPLAAGSYQYSIVDTGTNASNWLNGTLVKSTPYSRSGLTYTDIGFAFFTNSNSAGVLSSNFPGDIAEVIVYEAALTTFQRQAGENNQNAYYGT